MSERIASLNERVLRAIQAVDAAQQEIDRRIEGTRAVIEDERVALAWLKHKVDCSVPSKRPPTGDSSGAAEAIGSAAAPGGSRYAKPRKGQSRHRAPARRDQPQSTPNDAMVHDGVRSAAPPPCPTFACELSRPLKRAMERWNKLRYH
jgi:hypothetical protein